MPEFTICIGYDRREAVAWHVCAHSVMKHASRPLNIMPVMLDHIPEFTRTDALGSTEFSISRFLTPYIARTPVSVFVDCDFLFLADPWELYEQAIENPYADVLVCQHDYVPRHESKFLGATQYAYPRKNWSSLMVFNRHRMAVQRLTPMVVNHTSPADLHRFAWAKDIGELPLEWNWLVGEYERRPTKELKALHYTLGGPWFKPYQECDYAAEWFAAFEEMTEAETQHLRQEAG